MNIQIIFINDSIYVIIDEKKYNLLVLDSIFKRTKYSFNDYKLLKEIIISFKNELEAKKHNPNEVVNLIGDKYITKRIFILTSFILFNELFISYFKELIIIHMKSKNFDFIDFYSSNLNRNWLYEDSLVVSSITSCIKEIFYNEMTLKKEEFDIFVCKSKEYSAENSIWDFNYRGKLYKNISLSIPNSEIREIIYNRLIFITLMKELEFNILEKKSLKYLTVDTKIVLLIVYMLVLFFYKEFRNMLKYIANKLIDNYEIVNTYNMKNEIFGKLKTKSILYMLSINRNGNNSSKIKIHYQTNIFFKFSKIIFKEVNKAHEYQIKNRNKINTQQIRNKNLIIYNYFKMNNGNLNRIIIDFSDFSHFDILFEIKEYIKWLIVNQKQVVSELIAIKRLFNFLLTEFENKNFSLSNITSFIMQKFVLSLMSDNENSNLSVSTRKMVYSNIKKFIIFIIKNDISKKFNFKSPNENIFNNIEFKNVENHKNHIEPLPEEVYCQILNHLDRIDIVLKNIFLILSSTGFRWKEVLNLKKDCIYLKNDVWYIKAIEYKTMTLKSKKGKSIYRHVPIYDENTLFAIKNQINMIEELNFESDYIFTTRNKNFYNKEYSLPSNGRFTESINRIIRNYDIVTNDGVLWKYSPHQMRVRIATLMAESGFESNEISNFLNHSSTQTIEKAYAFVRQKRMSELNSNFFKNHFNSIITEDNLILLNKEEREDLYVNLYLNYRDMEYGKCIIPISGKDCGKLQEPVNCASCQYLVTSDKYLIKWKNFLDNQKKRIYELESFYKEKKILYEQYSYYSEYKREIFYFESYQELINKLEEH